jgi:DNA-binding XRE family transcriptional regulator
MSTLAQTLKSEISRLARHEVKVATDALRKSASTHRSEIAALKRLVASQQKELAALGKLAGKLAKGVVGGDAAPGGRPRRSWTPERIKGLRKRLGLSQGEFGQLAGGYSLATVSNWEHGQTPRAKAQADLNSIYGLGRREARARLA